MPNTISHPDALRAETVGVAGKQPVRLFVALENVLMQMKDGGIEDMCKPEWFIHQSENENIMKAIRSLRLKSIFDIYILIKQTTPLSNELPEKQEWMDRKYQTFPKSKIITVPYGKNVVASVPGSVHKADMLLSADEADLDDWRHNGGVSVKVFGKANKNTQHAWNGKYICDLISVDRIIDDLAILQPGIAVVRLADANSRIEDAEEIGEWMLVDKDSYMYMRCENNRDYGGGTYDAYKVLALEEESCAAHMTINLGDYSDESLLKYMNLFGYTKFEQICEPAYYGTNMMLLRDKMPRSFWNKIAEFIFRTELDNHPDFRKFDTIRKAQTYVYNIIRQAKPVGAA